MGLAIIKTVELLDLLGPRYVTIVSAGEHTIGLALDGLREEARWVASPIVRLIALSTPYRTQYAESSEQRTSSRAAPGCIDFDDWSAACDCCCYLVHCSPDIVTRVLEVVAMVYSLLLMVERERL